MYYGKSLKLSARVCRKNFTVSIYRNVKQCKHEIPKLKLKTQNFTAKIDFQLT